MFSTFKFIGTPLPPVAARARQRITRPAGYTAAQGTIYKSVTTTSFLAA